MKKYLAILLTMVLLLSCAYTASAASVSGNATESNGTITISGSVTDPANGQQVTVLVVNGSAALNSFTASDVVFMTQVAPTNGTYSAQFTLPAAMRTGTYDVYVGGTEVSTPAGTSYTFPTEAPTAAPVASEVELGTAKPAVNGSNAFYYLITITLNDGVTTGFNVKHYPSDLATQVEQDATIAESQDFSIANISGATVKVISVLKDIPNSEADRSITTKATLSFTLGGNANSATDTESTTLNTTKGN